MGRKSRAKTTNNKNRKRRNKRPQKKLTEDLEKTDVPFLTIIPEEVRIMIYSKLSERDLLNIRQVCHRWKDDVDSLAEFSIILDDRTDTVSNLERKLQLRSHTCLILSLEAESRHPQRLQNGNGRLPMRSSDVIPIFSHPDRIRRLSFGRLFEFSASMTDYLSFHSILVATAEYLRTLKVISNTSLLNSAFPARLSRHYHYPLNNLTEFQIEMDFNCTHLPCFITHCVYYRFLGGPPMPKLRSLEVFLWQDLGQHAYSAVDLTFLSIANNWRTLDTLMFRFMSALCPEDSLIRSRDLEIVDLDLLDKVADLKKCVLEVNMRLHGETEVQSDREQELFIRLLRNQRKLEYLATDLRPLSFPLLKDVIGHNSSTLQTVIIKDLNLEYRVPVNNRLPLDLSIFENCQQLRKLVVLRQVRCRRRHRKCQAINLISLPNSLKTLVLGGFTVDWRNRLALQAMSLEKCQLCFYRDSNWQLYDCSGMRELSKL